ncbi:MAG: metallophosphoesterase [Actinomycetota bacterium]
MPGHTSSHEVPNRIEVDVSPGERVFVVSDMHLWPKRTKASAWAAIEVARRLNTWEGPGVLVMAGDILEMWFVEPPDPTGSLDAHPEFVEAVQSFGSKEGRRVVYLVGNHDGRLGWDEKAISVVKDRLHAELALTAELVLRTPKGERRVRVEHGHAYDPANEFKNPHDPGETPLGQHIVQEILPEMTFADQGWLSGVDSLSDPRTFPAFLTSRLFYRRVLKDAKWLLIPVVLFLLVRIPVTYLFLGERGQDLLPRVTRRLVMVDAIFIAFVLLMVVILLIGARRAWHTASSAVATKRGAGQNDNTRAAAKAFIDQGFAGMVCGHTHHPEISEVEGGFYVNTGSGTQVVDRVPAKMGLPHVFVPRVQLSFVELEAGDDWTVVLTAGRQAVPGSTTTERRMQRKRTDAPHDLTVVGRWPGGPFTE